MNLLKDLFHFTMFLFGAVIIIDNLKYQNTLILINRIIITIILIKWI